MFVATMIWREPQLTEDVVSSNADKCVNSNADRCDPYFTQEQYKQILNLLNKEPPRHHANMTGIVTSLMTDLSTREWIIYSEASHHITSSLNRLQTKIELGVDNIE